jgi:hypothetical protein
LAFIRRKLPGPEATALVNRVRDIIVAGIRPDAVFGKSTNVASRLAAKALTAHPQVRYETAFFMLQQSVDTRKALSW